MTKIQQLLRKNPQVIDCAVVQSKTKSGDNEVRAFIVAEKGFQMENPPCPIVVVSSLPYLPTGKIDTVALNQLEVVDQPLVDAWKETMDSTVEIEEAVVLSGEKQEHASWWHLNTLLPDWKVREQFLSNEPLIEATEAKSGHDLKSDQLAICHGQRLVTHQDDPQTLTEILTRAAKNFPNQGVTYVQEGDKTWFQSYPDLLEEAQRNLTGLRKLGLKAGDQVIFQIECNEDFIPVFWGCVLGGIAPLAIAVSTNYREDNSITSKLVNLWERLHCPIILASDSVASEVSDLFSRADKKDCQVRCIDSLKDNAIDGNWHRSQPEDMALMLLTSGSTGLPKGVVQTHHNLVKRSTSAVQCKGFSEEEISLNWLPIDHVTGIVMCHIRDIYTGCQQIHIPTQMVLQKPLMWLDAIERFRATITWAPNFAFRLICDHEQEIKTRKWDLSSMKFMENAGEPIVTNTCRKFLSILENHGLPSTVIHPAWGMAETCSTVTCSNRFNFEHTKDDDPFTDLGEPFPGFSMRIVNEQNQILKEGEVGQFQCKGLTVLPEYYQNPKANGEAFTEEGWFNTGDLAYIKNGRLTLTGREKDLIIINGVNYYGHEIETAVEELDEIEVSYTAAVAIWNPVQGTDCLAIFFHTNLSDSEHLKALFDRIAKKSLQFGINPTYLVPVEKEDIPKTGIGKIQRSHLQARFNQGDFDEVLKQVDLLKKNSNCLPSWFFQKSWQPRNRSELTTQVTVNEGSKTRLIFLDHEGVGKGLAGQIRLRNEELVQVHPGDKFTRFSRYQYEIDPRDPKHYVLLCKSLRADQIFFEEILYLWAFEEEGQPLKKDDTALALHRSFYHLKFLTQALSQNRIKGEQIALIAITKAVHPVSCLASKENRMDSTSQSYLYAPIIGMLKSIPQDLPWLKTAHIDLDEVGQSQNVQIILDELSLCNMDAEVAFRDGKRWVPGLVRSTFDAEDKKDIPIKRGGTYLLSGGLGALGTAVAQWLLKEFDVSLILCGRSSLPARKTWGKIIEGDSAMGVKLQRLLELEKLGKVVYKTVGLTQSIELPKKKLDGIFHLAGEFGDSVFEAKVLGTCNLFKLIEKQPQALFVSFSSVAGNFGAISASAYSAANSFLEVFSAQARANGFPNVYCFAWSMWEDLGLSAGHSESVKKSIQNLGFHLIEQDRGVQSLHAALCHQKKDLFIGIDGENPRMRSLLFEETHTIEEVKIFYRSRNKRDLPARLQAIRVEDRWGTLSRGNFCPVETIPQDEDGNIDSRALLQNDSLGDKETKNFVIPQNELEKQINTIWQNVLRLNRTISVFENFFDLGGNSILINQVQVQLEEQLNRKILIVDLFQFPTIRSFSEHLNLQSGAVPYRTEGVASIESGKGQQKESRGIAVIGMSCRVPGADSPDEFWENLKAGVESIERLSDQDILDTGISPELLNDPNYVKAAPLLQGVRDFDADFFGYSPKEASVMDPQQRLFLEASWAALEDAGCDPQRYEKPIGVFGGTLLSTHLWYNVLPNCGYIQPEERMKNLVGNTTDCITSRVSYKLGLTGPSINVQTNCSTSLVAVHTACKSLLDSQCSVALAGGVAIRFPQKTGYLYQEGSLSSPDGHCRPFDENAGGTLFGDGVGILVLKRLEDAIEDGDEIHAVLMGGAVNNDGSAKVGYTAPSVEGQVEVIRMAHASAGLPVDSISYVEAHGTGTKMGDPIEVQALRLAFEASTQKKGFCTLGSVKSNIGHLETAAGSAGMIKIIESFKHRQLPPTLHFKNANPNIPFSDGPFQVKSNLSEWDSKEGLPLRAGISSFGIGGTNAHLVLEEAPKLHSSEDERPVKLIVLSAKSEEALQEMTANMASFIEKNPDIDLSRLAYTLQMGRQEFEHRQTWVCHNQTDLFEKLSHGGAEVVKAQSQEEPYTVFCFSGGGSQYLDMGKGLYETEPFFSSQMNRCFDHLKKAFDLDIRWVLFPMNEQREQAQHQLSEISTMLPLLFSLEYALARLLMHWGVQPDTMIGHSMGEYVVACLSEVFTLEDGLSLVVERARLMQRVEGAMLVVPLPESEVKPFLNAQVSVGAVNGPKACVLSGDRKALEGIEAELKEKGLDSRFVHISFPAHSALLDPILDEFRQCVENISLKAPKIPFISNVTGTWITKEQTTDPQYWATHLRNTVRFHEGIGELLKTSACLFVEVGPGHALSTFIGQQPKLSEDDTILTSLRHPKSSVTDSEFLMEALGGMWQAGKKINWDAMYYGSTPRKVRLPGYAFQRKECWPQSSPKNSRHPFLGISLPSSKDPGTTYYELDLSIAQSPWLKDHLVLQEVFFPGAAYIEVALAAAKEKCGKVSVVLKSFQFEKALIMEKPQGQVSHWHQCFLAENSPDHFTFQFHSTRGKMGKMEEWEQHAQGQIEWSPLSDRGEQPFVSISELNAGLDQEFDPLDFYRNISERGVTYGPAFHGISQIRKGAGKTVCQFDIPDQLKGGAYVIHPALLDIFFQVALVHLPERENDPDAQERPFFPVRLESFQLHGDPNLATHGYIASDPQTSEAELSDSDVIEKDIRILDSNGRVLLEILGFRLERIPEKTMDEKTSNLFHGMEWEIQPLIATPNAPLLETENYLILSDEKGCGEALATRMREHGRNPILLKASQKEELIASLNKIEGNLKGIVYLSGLDSLDKMGCPLSDLERTPEKVCMELLHCLNGITSLDSTPMPRLWIVTEYESLTQSPLLGLGRVVLQEYPDLFCTNLQIDSDGPETMAAIVFDELVGNKDEDQVVLAKGERRVPRLRKVPHLLSQEDEATWISGSEKNFRLRTSSSNLLDDLYLEEAPTKTLGENEVRIQVDAVGLNFRDVMLAMGISPSSEESNPLEEWTGELVGTVLEIGPGAIGFQKGDRVIAFASNCFDSEVVLSTDYVVLKPSHLSQEEAATISVAFLTAYYGLIHLGRLSSGEKVLIHSATGGVGLAAVQIAKMVGAEIFATAGSLKKRDFLKSLGIQHVMDSRSLDYAEEIQAITEGQGVDVVLNSLSGKAIAKNFSVLSDFGRYLEMGIKDIQENSRLDMQPFGNNLSYNAFSVRKLALKRPKDFKRMFETVMQEVQEKRYQALPFQTFSIAEVQEAFRHMNQSKHIGKIVIALDSPTVKIKPLATPLIEEEACYLITGGLSGIGLAFAEWMVSQGAQHLVLLGRRGVTEESEPVLKKMAEQGGKVHVFHVDIAIENDLKQVLSEIEHTLPPLKGIIHSAGLIEDAPLSQLTERHFQSVMAPKVYGTWNLHEWTLGCPLNFFVCFSSVSSMLGIAGQGNYAAANAFMDQFASYRKSLGLPILTVNWGSWAKIGLAAAVNVRGSRLASRGLGNLMPENGIHALEKALMEKRTHVSVMEFEATKWTDAYPGAKKSGLFRGLAQKHIQSVEAFSNRLETSSKNGQGLKEEVENELKQNICAVLGIEASRLKSKTLLNTLGLDSLMSIELRNRIESSLGVRLKLVNFIKGTSLAQLMDEVLAELQTIDMPERQDSQELPPILAGQKEDTYPLSLSQQMVLDFEAEGPGLPHFNVPMQFAFKGTLDVSALEKSLFEILKRHDILRAYLPKGRATACQAILPQVSLSIRLVVLEDGCKEQCELDLQAYLAKEARQKFDLNQPPLYRVTLYRMAENKHVLHVVVSHLLLDGWSIQLFNQELRELYKNFSEGKRPALPSVGLQFTDFVQWEQEHFLGEYDQQQQIYWKEKLKGAPFHLQLPIDHLPSNPRIWEASHLTAEFSESFYQDICRFAQKQNSTPFMVLMAAFKILMFQWTGKEDLVIGTSNANRNQVELQDMMGSFFGPMPLRTTCNENHSGLKWLEQVKTAALEMQNSPHCSLKSLQECNVYFAVHSFDMFDQYDLNGTLEVELSLGRTLASPYELLAMVLPNPHGGVTLWWSYHQDLFYAESIETLMARYEKTVSSFIEHSHWNISEIVEVLMEAAH